MKKKAGTNPAFGMLKQIVSAAAPATAHGRAIEKALAQFPAALTTFLVGKFAQVLEFLAQLLALIGGEITQALIERTQLLFFGRGQLLPTLEAFSESLPLLGRQAAEGLQPLPQLLLVFRGQRPKLLIALPQLVALVRRHLLPALQQT
jgi:hypothetical protein